MPKYICYSESDSAHGFAYHSVCCETTNALKIINQFHFLWTVLQYWIKPVFLSIFVSRRSNLLFISWFPSEYLATFYLIFHKYNSILFPFHCKSCFTDFYQNHAHTHNIYTLTEGQGHSCSHVMPWTSHRTIYHNVVSVSLSHNP